MVPIILILYGNGGDARDERMQGVGWALEFLCTPLFLELDLT